MNQAFIGTYFKTKEVAQQWINQKNRDRYLREIGYTILEFKNGFMVVGKNQAELLR